MITFPFLSASRDATCVFASSQQRPISAPISGLEKCTGTRTLDLDVNNKHSQACSYGRGKAQPCKEHSLPSLPENVLSQGPHDRTRENRARRKEENLQRGRVWYTLNIEYWKYHFVYVLNISLQGELSTLWQNFPAQVGFEHSHILGARRPSFIPCQIIQYANFIGISIVGRIFLKPYLIGIVRASSTPCSTTLKRWSNQSLVITWSIQKKILPKWYF